jgi:hypothetical protein
MVGLIEYADGVRSYEQVGGKVLKTNIKYEYSPQLTCGKRSCTACDSFARGRLGRAFTDDKTADRVKQRDRFAKAFRCPFELSRK